MKITDITSLIIKYDNLLTRYAFFFTKNRAAADRIVMQVFEQYYEQQEILEQQVQRKYLQEKTKALCHQWLHKNVLAFIYKPAI